MENGYKFWHSSKFQMALVLVWLVACFAAAFAPAPAFAQPPGTHPSYVSIQMRTDALDSKPLTTNVCGGVVIDEKRKLIVTAWHCVPNQRSLMEKPGIFSVNGMAAKLLVFTAEADMAIFQVADLKGVKAPAFKTPKRGDIVMSTAFYNSLPVSPAGPMVDRFFPPMSISTTLEWEGKVMAVEKANRREGPQFDQIVKTNTKWIVATGDTAPGFSGSPVFDKAGNFVGIISSVNGGFTNISSSENVTLTLKQLP